MENLPSSETLDLDAEHFVLLETSRQWPKYVATWSVRRREGDSDYPVSSGSVERMPPSPESPVDDLLADLRSEALAAAEQAAGNAPGAAVEPNRSFLDRLLGR
jgi:hypothetical protein